MASNQSGSSQQTWIIDHKEQSGSYTCGYQTGEDPVRLFILQLLIDDDHRSHITRQVVKAMETVTSIVCHNVTRLIRPLAEGHLTRV